MSKLQELINELCPNGVECKKLEECCNILDRKRKPITKSARESGVYPYYGANGIQDYVSNYIFEGKYILVGEDGSVITSDGKPVVNWAEGKIWVNNHAHIVEEKNGVLLRYLYHFIQTVNISEYIHGNIPKFTGGDFKSLEILVPPLPVQEEIVRILDKMTDYVAELKAELKARKMQYEYYRDELFTKWCNELKFETLGSVCRLVAGATPSKTKPEYWEDGTIPWMSSGEVNYKRIWTTENKITQKGYDNASTTLVPAHSIVIALAGQGKTRGKVAITEIELCTNQSLCSIICGERINYKYLYYYLDGKYDELRSISNGDGTRGGLSLRILTSYKIPVIPLETQNRIVNILDRFDTLCNDISSGLPAEIEARQKQYEYYRDKLLSFKETSHDAI